jgi:vacuolar-type H+-ATPase subunit I/STV1
MSNEIKKALRIENTLDKKSADFLSKALAANTTEGFNYIKFRQAINAMDKIGLDEATSFKSAFATANTIGLTKTGLVSSAKHYLSVLMNEKGKFDEALAHRVKEKIASKSEQVLKLEQRIEEMKKKIVELEKKISESQQKIDAADEDVEREKEKIRLTQENFEHTFTTFVKVIKDDIAKVNEHIQTK